MVSQLVFSRPTCRVTEGGHVSDQTEMVGVGLKNLIGRPDWGFIDTFEAIATDIQFDFGVGFIHIEPTPDWEVRVRFHSGRWSSGSARACTSATPERRTLAAKPGLRVICAWRTRMTCSGRPILQGARSMTRLQWRSLPTGTGSRNCGKTWRLRVFSSRMTRGSWFSGALLPRGAGLGDRGIPPDADDVPAGQAVPRAYGCRRRAVHPVRETTRASIRCIRSRIWR